MMNLRHIPGLALLCALLLGLLARAASLTHGADADAETRNSAGAYAHHADPGDGCIRWAGAVARADIGAFVSTSTELPPPVASVEARVKAERGQVDMLVLTTQTGSLLGAWATRCRASVARVSGADPPPRRSAPCSRARSTSTERMTLAA